MAYVRQGVMDCMTAGECVTLSDIMLRVGCKGSSAWRALTGMITDGLVRRVERGCYELTIRGVEIKNGGAPVPRRPRKIEGPKATSPRSKIWRALRLARGWVTAQEIALLVTGDDEAGISMQIIHDYLRPLHGAGYLQRRFGVMKGHIKGSHGRAAYRLSPGRDTGPLHPAICEVGVRDPNTGVVWPINKEVVDVA